MQLEPCVSCHRHVAAMEPVCPFCGASRAVPPASGLDRRWTGRASRAAVFSATLAGCYVAPAPQAPPPPPPDDTQRYAQPPPPPPPDDRRTDTQVVHQPPPPPPPTDVARSVIHGRVVEAGTNRPVAGVRVYAVHDSGRPAEARTDARGEYRLEQLAAGGYILRFEPPWPMRSDPRSPDEPLPERRATLGDGTVARVDAVVHRPTPPRQDFDRGPCCKPYGAPPARRRVV